MAHCSNRPSTRPLLFHLRLLHASLPPCLFLLSTDTGLPPAHGSPSLSASRLHKPQVRISCRPESLARKGANPATRSTTPPTPRRQPSRPRQPSRRRPHLLASASLLRRTTRPTSPTTQTLPPPVELAASAPRSTPKTPHPSPRHVPKRQRARPPLPCLPLGLCQALLHTAIR